MKAYFTVSATCKGNKKQTLEDSLINLKEHKTVLYFENKNDHGQTSQTETENMSHQARIFVTGQGI